MTSENSPSVPQSGESKTNWTGVIFGFLIASFAAFQQFKLPPILPDLLQEFSYDRTIAGGFMSIYALVGLLFSVLIGHAIGKLGALKFLYFALVLFVLGNVLALMWPEFIALMLASRGLEGLGFAIFAILGPVYANRNAGAKHLPIAIALTAMWIPVGQLLANFLAPISETLWGWQLLWAVAIGLSLVIALWLRSIHTGKRVELSVNPPQSAEARPDEKLSKDERTALIISAAVFMLWSNQYFAYMTWLPQFLIEERGMGRTGAIIGYSVPITILIVFSLITAGLMRRGFSTGPLLIFALVIQAAVWFAIPWTTSNAAGVVSLLVYGVGIGISPVCLFGAPSTILGSNRAGPKAFAVLMTGRNLGVLVGPILLPAIIVWRANWTEVGQFFGAATLVGLTLAIWLQVLLRRLRRA